MIGISAHDTDPTTPALTSHLSNVLVPFMSAQAIHAEAHDTAGPHDADTQGYRQVLHDLIHLGADLARCLHGQATAQAVQAMAHPAQQAMSEQPALAPGAPNPNALISLTVAFDRIARAVRRGILLARSLDEPIQPARDPAQARAATRRRIIREVEDAIQRTGRDASDGRDGPEALQAELRDRLDAPDLDDDISLRPAAEIITEICRDLGLAALPGTHPWKRRTPEDIRQLCAAALSSAAHPTARQPGTGPLLRRDAAQPIPGPQPDKPAVLPRTQPDSIHAGNNPPEDQAGTLATILRHPPRVHGQWRPPPRA